MKLIYKDLDFELKYNKLKIKHRREKKLDLKPLLQPTIANKNYVDVKHSL